MTAITVNMGGGRTCVAQGTETYTGTGGANIETYDVAIMGHAASGTWDGDARHNTYVADPSAALRAALLPTLRAQEAARERQELAALQAKERRLYGRVLTRE